MSDLATAPAPAASAPGSDQGSPAAPVAAAPEGFVPLTEVEKAREEGRRAAQSEYDRRLHAETERIRAEALASAAPKGDGEGAGSDPGFDRASLLREVAGVITMSQTADRLKAEFPHADPGLFAPERVSQFGSPDALRFAAEDSHRRVAAILETERASIEERLRQELAERLGDAGAGAGGGGTPPAGGDPTLQQLATMSISQLDALEAANPGVIERVKRAGL